MLIIGLSAISNPAPATKNKVYKPAVRIHIMLSKARVLEVKRSKAVVEMDGKKKTLKFRPDIEIKKGDAVFVALGTIVDKA